jgi:hypothetical protein
MANMKYEIKERLLRAVLRGISRAKGRVYADFILLSEKEKTFFNEELSKNGLKITEQQLGVDPKLEGGEIPRMIIFEERK